MEREMPSATRRGEMDRFEEGYFLGQWSMRIVFAVLFSISGKFYSEQFCYGSFCIGFDVSIYPCFLVVNGW